MSKFNKVLWEIGKKTEDALKPEIDKFFGCDFYRNDDKFDILDFHDDNNKDDNKIITKIITLLTKNSKTSKDQFYVDNFGLSIIRIDGKFIFFLLPWRDSLINVPGSMLLCSEQSRVSA